MYQSLAPAKIVETCRMLQHRIAERFPGSGLSKVAVEIASTSEEAAGLTKWLSKPHLPLRILAGLGILCVLSIVLGGLWSVKLPPTFSSVAEFLQGSEAALNEIVFLGIAVIFLITLENRLKRRRALKAIHVLRSIAHIIDMHQLTKDPERITGPLPATEPGAKRSLSPSELIRYLDYCTDLLALSSKIAALYVQKFDDPVTLAAVNEVENLTNGLSRKIWQKIMILDRIIAPAGATALPLPPEREPTARALRQK
jgi:hypothetical protein